MVDEGVVRLDAGALGVVRRGGGAGEGVAAAGLVGIGCVEPGVGALVSGMFQANGIGEGVDHAIRPVPVSTFDQETPGCGIGTFKIRDFAPLIQYARLPKRMGSR
ncbi:hypothetical protein [Streptomyces ambofaciens]